MKEITYEIQIKNRNWDIFTVESTLEDAIDYVKTLVKLYPDELTRIVKVTREELK